jgi:hypothetical protein
MSLINMSASGTTIQKSGGCSGCPDGSAVSEQQISGSGSLQFAAAETGTLRIIGLSAGSIGTAPGDIAFALRLQGGTAEVREFGSYKSETSFQSGDTFRIAVENGTVRYSKNGSVFYTSGSQSSSAARVHAVFFDANATLRDVVIGSGSSSASSSSAASSPSSTTTSTSSRVKWPRKK